MSKESFYVKLSKFRGILNSQDWSLDGYNEKQNYHFLSHRKMKSNVSKALVEAGLEWKVDFSDWSKEQEIGMMKQHYIIKAVAVITDVDNPDDYVEMVAFGEASDSGDKGMTKAQTSAFKALIANNLMVSEMDEEGEEVESTNDAIRSEAKSHYEAKQEIIKSKVIRESAKGTGDEKKPTTTAKNHPAVVSAEGSISDTQKKVMDKIITKAEVMSDVELEKFGSREQIVSDFESVKTAEDALKFITAYQGVIRCR